MLDREIFLAHPRGDDRQMLDHRWAIPLASGRIGAGFNTDGSVNASDVSQVKVASGTLIP